MYHFIKYCLLFIIVIVDIKDKDNLILRKKVATKTYHLKFELPEQKDLVSASFDSSTQVKVPIY